MNRERRQHPRVEAHRLVAFQRARGAESGAQEGFFRTLNLAPGGLLVESDYRFQTGENLKLQILTESILTARGEVVHQRSSRPGMAKVGVRFTRIGKATREALKREMAREASAAAGGEPG